MRDESASAVALFTEDGSFWVADERTPTGRCRVWEGRDRTALRRVVRCRRTRLAIEEPTHSVDLDEERLLQSGVFTRTITVRGTGNEVEERGGYVRLIRNLNGDWKYQVLSVVVLQPRR